MIYKNNLYKTRFIQETLYKQNYTEKKLYKKRNFTNLIVKTYTKEK